jgi:hypothetical protein
MIENNMTVINQEDNEPVIEPNIEMELSKEKRDIVREIIKEIKNFGVSQRQLVYLIFCLSMELENIVLAKELTSLIGKHRSKIPVQVSEQNNPKKKLILV